MLGINSDMGDGLVPNCAYSLVHSHASEGIVDSGQVVGHMLTWLENENT